MSITSSRGKLTGALVFAFVYLVEALVFSGVQAEQNAGEKNAINVEELTQRIKQEIMQELRESDFLRKEIENGIQWYVEKQRQAQRSARATQARIASEKAKNVRRVSWERVSHKQAGSLGQGNWSGRGRIPDLPGEGTIHRTRPRGSR